MTVERSYHLYCDQYRRHLDEYMAFVSGVNWNMNRITVTVKGKVLTLTRPGKRLQEIEGQETAT